MRNYQYLTIDGTKKRLTDVAREKGMPAGLLRRRYRAGFRGNKLFAPAIKTYGGDGSYKFSLSSGLTPKGH